MWAGQCIAAAGVFPAARNCSVYPAKLMVVERWCLWLTISWVYLAAPSLGECSQGCVHPLVQLCKDQGVMGRVGEGRVGWTDGWGWAQPRFQAAPEHFHTNICSSAPLPTPLCCLFCPIPPCLTADSLAVPASSPCASSLCLLSLCLGRLLQSSGEVC